MFQFNYLRVVFFIVFLFHHIVETGVMLTLYFEIFGLLQQEIQIGERVRYKEAGVPHEIQNVTEHAAVPVDEVMLFQRVQHNRYRAVEELRQP